MTNPGSPDSRRFDDTDAVTQIAELQAQVATAWADIYRQDPTPTAEVALRVPGAYVAEGKHAQIRGALRERWDRALAGATSLADSITGRASDPQTDPTGIEALSGVIKRDEVMPGEQSGAVADLIAEFGDLFHDSVQVVRPDRVISSQDILMGAAHLVQLEQRRRQTPPGQPQA